MAKETRAQIITNNKPLLPLATITSGKNADGSDWKMRTLSQDEFPSLQQLAKEGHPLDANLVNTANAAVAAAAAVTNSPFAVVPGRCAWIEGITYFVVPAATGTPVPVQISAYLNDGTFGLGLIAGRSWLIGGLPAAGGTIYFPVRRFIYEGGGFASGVFARTAGTAPDTHIHVAGFDFTSDFNFAAEKKILIIGDSITWSSIGLDPAGAAYSGKTLYAMRLAERLRGEGKSVRLINKGFGGATSVHGAKAIENGYIDGIDYDLLIVAFGMNDAANNSTSQAAFEANLKAFIEHRNTYRPNASIIFVAPNVTDSATRITSGNIAGYRTYVQNVANDNTFGGAGRKVYFYDSSSAFALNGVATLDTNFSTGERVAGSRVHPSGAGHGLIANGLFNVVQQTDFYQNF